MPHTLIFDIGKTNKKLFVFDRSFQLVHQEYAHFDEVQDDDGFPADNLPAIAEWVKERTHKLLNDKHLAIGSVNFSTYGASFVHLDSRGRLLTPLYNYTRPFPQNILQKFHARHGPQLTIASQTSSPPLGMLNSGLQLYWLKNEKPDIFRQIRHSLHLPQYISYCLTGIPVSDFTSIGCHTALWHFSKKDNHDWVYFEEIDRILPPLVATGTTVKVKIDNKYVQCGVGIHDSSAALLTYLRTAKGPFLLISTGTWSVALNPFSEAFLLEEDLENDCLCYLLPDGKPVRACRLFLGNEYQLQVEKLCACFKKESGYDRTVQFDEKIFREQSEQPAPKFHFESLHQSRPQPNVSKLADFQNFETAYHRLMIELTELQADAARRAMRSANIETIYVDGGFAGNEIFVKLMARHVKNHTLYTSQAPLGSALGAALVIADNSTSLRFLKKYKQFTKIKV